MIGSACGMSRELSIAAWDPVPDADYDVAPTSHQSIIRQNKETGDRTLIRRSMRVRSVTNQGKDAR